MSYINLIRRINRFFIQHVKGSHYFLPAFNRLFIPKTNSVTEVETIFGFSVNVSPTDNAVEKAVYERGIYEQGTMSVIDLFLQEGDSFVDVGANIGLMTLLAATKTGPSGKVCAVEANPVILVELQKNITKNNFNFVRIESCALGAFTGTGVLSENNFTENRGASTMLDNNRTEDKNYSVAVKTLDGLFDDTYDLIKIDVEGWETEVLDGGERFFSSANAPAIIIECSADRVNNKDDRAEIYNKIKRINDYKIFKLKNGKERKGKLIEVKNEADLPLHDNLFCFLAGHVQRLQNNMFS